ncbi:MAG: hypothetical protein HND58_11430 [Planctomycetota bacterium]|nr:MAG: hypothetical protein HND58_11430 [Planctomycetota bacterium]
MDQFRVSLPAPPASELGFPPSFVRSGPYLVRGAGTQLVGADLRSASVVWEAAAGPGWPDADEMMWGAGDGTCVAVVTGVRGRLTVRGVAAETGAVHWKREISPADTRQLWNSLVAGEMPEVERRACVLRRADMLVVALSSNPVRIERTESGEGSTHLSTGQPLVEFVRLDPADGGVMWRTGVARAACASFALSHRFGGLACCDGAISSLDWETGRWVPLTDAGSQPDCLARSGPIVGAVWRERGGLRLATLDTRDGTVRRGSIERGVSPESLRIRPVTGTFCWRSTRARSLFWMRRHRSGGGIGSGRMCMG